MSESDFQRWMNAAKQKALHRQDRGSLYDTPCIRVSNPPLAPFLGPTHIFPSAGHFSKTPRRPAPLSSSVILYSGPLVTPSDVRPGVSYPRYGRTANTSERLFIS